MNGPDESAGSFVAPVRIDTRSDLAELCHELRRSLHHDHAHCPDAERTGLARQLLEHDSPARQILARGFQRIVVFDAQEGIAESGVFELATFLRYVSRNLADAFEIEFKGGEFHPEEVSQILKDEQETTLFCFIGIQHIPYEALQRLRGFTQESHRCLFCGPHDFGRADARQSPGRDVEISDFDFVPTRDSDDSAIDLALNGDDVNFDSDIEQDSDISINASDSGVALVMNTVNVLPELPGADFLDSPLFDDPDGKLVAIMHQASLLLAGGQLDSAMEWLTVAQDMLAAAEPVLSLSVDTVDTDQSMAACLALQAEVEIARGDWQAALNCLQQEQELHERAGMNGALVTCLDKQSTLLKRHGRLDQALALLLKQADLSRQMGLASVLAASLAGQAQIHEARGDQESALVLLVKQEQVCRLNAFHELLLQCLGQRAIILRRTGDFGLALAVLREQVRVAQAIGKTDVVAVAYGNQAAIHERNRNFALAEDLYQQGEQLCRRLGDNELLVRNLANQAFLLSTKMHRHREALPRANEALALATVHGMSSLAKQIQPICQSIRSRL